MATKYYHAENSGRGPIGGVKFDTYGIFGTARFGIYATDDETIQAKLDALVGKSGVTEIPADEYAACAKKKLSAPDSISESLNFTPHNMGSVTQALKGLAGTVVIEPAAAGSTNGLADNVEAPVEVKVAEATSVEDALSLEPASPAVNAPVESGSGKNRSRGKRETQ